MGRAYIPPGVAEQFELRLQAASKSSKETAWEDALKEIEEAELLTRRDDFPELPGNEVQLRLLLQRGILERRRGNYENATDLFRQALLHVNTEETTTDHLGALGELGTALLQQEAFGQASDVFQQQYALATAAASSFHDSWEQDSKACKGLEAHACSAVGNRAFTLYHLAVPRLDGPGKSNEAQLSSIVDLLKERLERARSLREKLRNPGRMDKADTRDLWNSIIAWQSAALDRLTLCYLALGDVETALKYGLKSVAMSEKQPNGTVSGLSRFHYGLALHYGGRTNEAIDVWKQTGKNDECTAAIALSREASTENIKHLQLLAQLGAGFSHHDEDGYSVLDYAVLSNSARMKSVAIEGLQQEFTLLDESNCDPSASKVQQRIQNALLEAQRRNKYRQTFQLTFRSLLKKISSGYRASHIPCRPVSGWTYKRSWLRPVVRLVLHPLSMSEDEIYLRKHARHQEGIDSLRQGYLRQREMSSETRSMFDRLVMVRYHDFKSQMKCLPRPCSKDDMNEVMHLRRGYAPTQEEKPNAQPGFLIFLSYRWLGNGSPDDDKNTQYKRMLRALELYFKMHPWLDRNRVSVWLVSRTICLHSSYKC